MAPVLIMFSATFVAVPAFNRVDPVKSSGPTSSEITRLIVVAGIDDLIWPAWAPPATAGLHVSKIVFAPDDFARESAPSIKGVLTLAFILTTTSLSFTPR